MSRSSFDDAFARAADVATLIQGEVLAAPDACVVIADSRWPLDERSAKESADAAPGLIVVPHAVDLVVLLTQTCDLQQTTPESYLCQVAPVIERADPGFVRQVERGRRPGWVALPWHDELSIGDLSRITTVERNVVANAARRGHPRTPTERLNFAESVSRHLTRVALPESIVTVLRPVLERMKDRHDRNSPEGRCINRLASIRLEVFPDIDTDNPDIRILFVLESNDLPSLPAGVEISDDNVDELVTAGLEAVASAIEAAADVCTLREAWQALAELWIQPAVQAAAGGGSGIGIVDVEVLNGEEMSFSRSRQAPELDLAHLSSRAA